MNAERGKTLVVHPDDVNLADTKALAARYGTTVVGNPYCPRGQIFVIDPAALERRPLPHIPGLRTWP